MTEGFLQWGYFKFIDKSGEAWAEHLKRRGQKRVKKRENGEVKEGVEKGRYHSLSLLLYLKREVFYNDNLRCFSAAVVKDRLRRARALSNLARDSGVGCCLCALAETRKSSDILKRNIEQTLLSLDVI